MQLLRQFRTGLVVLAICGLASLGAQAAGVLLLVKKPAPRPAAPAIAHAVPAKAAVIRPKIAPKLAFRAPAPRLPQAVPAKPVVLTPSIAPALTDASRPVLVAMTGDWSVFAASADGNKTCFSATQPKDSEPKQDSRAPSFVYLTSNSAGTVKQELTIKLGFSAPAGVVAANVDGRDFALLAAGDVAYAPNEQAQLDLLTAMRHGHTMVLRTTLSGYAAGAVIDSISLLGVDDSMRLIEKACANPAPAP